MYRGEQLHTRVARYYVNTIDCINIIGFIKKNDGRRGRVYYKSGRIEGKMKESDVRFYSPVARVTLAILFTAFRGFRVSNEAVCTSLSALN